MTATNVQTYGTCTCKEIVAGNFRSEINNGDASIKLRSNDDNNLDNISQIHLSFANTDHTMVLSKLIGNVDQGVNTKILGVGSYSASTDAVNKTDGYILFTHTISDSVANTISTAFTSTYNCTAGSILPNIGTGIQIKNTIAENVVRPIGVIGFYLTTIGVATKVSNFTVLLVNNTGSDAGLVTRMTIDGSTDNCSIAGSVYQKYATGIYSGGSTSHVGAGVFLINGMVRRDCNLGPVTDTLPSGTKIKERIVLDASVDGEIFITNVVNVTDVATNGYNHLELTTGGLGATIKGHVIIKPDILMNYTSIVKTASSPNTYTMYQNTLNINDTVPIDVHTGANKTIGLDFFINGIFNRNDVGGGSSGDFFPDPRFIAVFLNRENGSCTIGTTFTFLYRNRKNAEATLNMNDAVYNPAGRTYRKKCSTIVAAQSTKMFILRFYDVTVDGEKIDVYSASP